LIVLCGVFRGPTGFLTDQAASFIYSPIPKEFNPCNTNNTDKPPSLFHSVTYFKISQRLDCDFNLLEKNLGNYATLAIVSIEDLVALSLKNRTSNKPFIFVPNSLSAGLEVSPFASKIVYLDLYMLMVYRILK